MRALSAATACTTILCRMYNDEIVHVHHEAGHDDAGLAFAGRGRPLPLFRGSASKTMLAFLPQPRLKKIHEQHRDEPDAHAIGAQWPEFRAYYAAIRQAGHYMSNQEVDPGTVGIAAPINVPRVGPVGVLSLVFAAERLALVDTDALAMALKARTREIGARLRLLSQQAEGAKEQEEPAAR
jgi:DNA-binding IclR family transcriptional regulator